MTADTFVPEERDDDHALPAFAVIGIAGRFPGARNPAELWRNLRAGTESITFFSDAELLAAGESPERLSDPAYVRASGKLGHIAEFDASFFGISPRDAAVFDPQHRLFLECAWEAFESAGYVGDQFRGPVGVFASTGGAEYYMHNLLRNRQIMQDVGAWLVRHTGNDQNFLATRVSYELNVTGPSMNVQSACSSSLLAVHLACQSLLNGECDMALAGGATVYPNEDRGYLYKQGEILSPDGHCRPFDAASAGTVMASAVGAVVLRRLEDAIRDGDQILAVVRGSAVNNDGSQKVGYLAPSVTGQARVVSEALAIAGVGPEDVSYIETHGTGTLIGDPIEITALTQAFRAGTNKTHFCAIGSLKSNIGHAGEASGICGFIKTVLALHHREIAPSLHFETPNPQIDFEHSPFFVNTRLRAWDVPPGKTRIAGVTSLGAGGTNVHVVLEEAPAVESTPASRAQQHLLLVSARTPTALDRASHNLAEHLRANPDQDLGDVAYTLLTGRKHFAHRRAIVAAGHAAAAAALESARPKSAGVLRKDAQAPSVYFMFPGGGAQYLRMGAELYANEPTYRMALDEALACVEPRLQSDLRALILGDASDRDAAGNRLEAPSRALPALLATEYAIARQLEAWGISPKAMIGHSAGEYAAACLAGVITLREAMNLVAMRGRLFERLAPGAMLSVSLPVEEARQIAGLELSIAAVNAPSLCVLSGPVTAIAAAEETLQTRGVECTRVHINVAAHSTMVDPILPEFEHYCRTIQFKKPHIPFISNVSGTWITDAEATDPTYWVRHLRSTVRFGQGLRSLTDGAASILCEIGPGRTLSSLARQQTTSALAITPTLRHPREQESDVAFLLGAVGQMWTAGLPLDPTRLVDARRHRRVQLPTYAFERQRFWIEPDATPATAPREAAPFGKQEDMADWFYAPSWAQSAPPVATAASPRGWLVLTDGSELAKLILQQLRRTSDRVIEVTAGERFARRGERAFAVNPASRTDFEQLASVLQAEAAMPERIVHLWPLEPRAGQTRGRLSLRSRRNPLASYQRDLGLFYFSLTHLAQTFGSRAGSLRLFCVSSNLQSVPGDADLEPEKALLLGACKVISREYPHVSCVAIDVRRASSAAEQRQIAQRLVGEFNAETEPTDVEVALRGGTRWVRRFDRVRLQQVEGHTWLRDGGVYVITGGLGGIGLRVAEHLARSGRVKLALIARTPLPAEPEDDRLGDEGVTRVGVDRELARRLQAVRAIRALGAEVMTVAADVTDIASMRRALASVRARFGAIHGVFHAAGVLHDELIAMQKDVRTSPVIDSKVKGALVLDELLAREPLDLFVTFSSVSSILGLPGQADYSAANAFLDAFSYARTQRATGVTLSVNWNAWQAGMLARSASKDAHPALGEVVDDGPRATLFRARLSRASTWLLGEHVVRGGTAVMPGTGFLDIVRAAVQSESGNGSVELRDVTFLAPFTVADNEQRSLNVRIERGGSRGFVCYAELIDEPLVTGRAAYVQPELTEVVDLAAVRARCVARGEVLDDRLVQHFMDFGPRWSSVKEIALGDGEALISLALPDEFVHDLDIYRLHPALLDMATGAAQALVPGFDNTATFYVPFTYGRVLIGRALTGRVFSHVRLRDSSTPESLSFDVSLYDESGQELVRIDSFIMRKAAARFMPARAKAGKTAGTFAPSSTTESATDIAIRAAMTPDEGVEALDRILALQLSPQIVACTVPLHTWLDRLTAEAHISGGDESPSHDTEQAATFDRPSLGADFVAPRNAIEQHLATLWSGLLGLAQVGVNDDFFELGGHSLIAVRLFTRIKRDFGVDLPLETLLRAPTIAACARVLQVEHGITPSESQVDSDSESPSTEAAEPTPAVSTLPTFAARDQKVWSPLVPIQLSGSRAPFFCVHGAGGNVLNFRDLSRALGEDQPFYGLQAQGVDGKLPRLSRIEDMAAQYLAAVRTVQPHGPYLLGGYSGGGVVAFEMAQQLRAAGEDISLLVLLDTFTPRASAPGSRLDEARQRFLKLQHRVRNLPYRMRLAWYSVIERPLPDDLGRFLGLRLEHLSIDAFFAAERRYERRPYAGRALLFRAIDADPEVRELGDDLGWAKWITSGLEVRPVPGTHANCLLQPNVEALAAALSKAIGEVGARELVLAA